MTTTGDLSTWDPTTVETAVERIWHEVLGTPEGSRTGTFFELEGDSITAVQLTARIEDEVGIGIDVGDIFEDDPDLPSLIRTVLTKAAR